MVRFFIYLLILLFPVLPGRCQQTGFVESDGFRLNYIIDGEGPPLLVIGSSLYYDRTFSLDLRRHFKMIFIDHRGFVPPNGERDTSDFSLSKITADVELIRQNLSLGKVIILGHSGHSYMALEYAKRYPENVSRLVMAGIAPDLGPEHTGMISRYWEESVDKERKQALRENMKMVTDDDLAAMIPGDAFIANYVRSGPMAWYDPHFDASEFWKGVHVNTQMLDYVWGKVFAEIDITSGLDELDIPVFLALGRYDYLVAPPASWDPYRQYFNDLTIRVFEKSGHTPFYEQPEDFDRELLAWVNQ